MNEASSRMMIKNVRHVKASRGVFCTFEVKTVEVAMANCIRLRCRMLVTNLGFLR